ncbi:hypothetical protein MUP01_12150 [Candidatus Bathyarchaeota archaeon]|nr:hypothetical protein [Candidatus Bathyarchaeota archaeon]
MSEHEHKFEESEGSLYSVCSCGAVRHDRDSDVFRNIEEARDTARKSGRFINRNYAVLGLAFSVAALGCGAYFRDVTLLITGIVEASLSCLLALDWVRSVRR